MPRRLSRALKQSAISFLLKQGLLQTVLDLQTAQRIRSDRRAIRSALRRMGRADRATVRESQDLEAVVDAGYGLVARRVERQTVLDIIEANRRVVTESLGAAGIAYSAVPLERKDRLSVAVSLGDREKVLSALMTGASESTYLYLPGTAIRRRARLTRLARRAPPTSEASSVSTWRVFEPIVARGMVFGSVHGCDIEFWSPDSTGTHLLAQRWNRSIPSVAVAEFGTARLDVGGRSVAVCAGTLELDHIDDVCFPVDLVYTWVDGHDPEWLASKARAFDHLNLASRNEEAANDARFQSFDELRYSLRSVEVYGDFARHIYIVTDAQRPEWLVDDHPRLSVVDHREIFPEDASLPTFNSHAIESRLHHIPGLSDHFVYLNDDFFLGRRVDANRFFHGNGLAKFFQSRARIPLGIPGVATKPADAAAMNGRAAVLDYYNVVASRKYKHVPYPLRRDVLLDIEEVYGRAVRRTTSSQVRSPSDLALASSLHHQVAYATGRATEARIRSSYIGTSDPNLRGRLDQLRRRTDLDVFCLNDDGVEPERYPDVLALVREFLEDRFPIPSTFERSQVPE